MAAEYPEDLLIKLPSGLQLEANLWTPRPTQGNQEDQKLAICLHPWSWLGGGKDDPVLQVLVEPLLSKKYHVIQYNSRGVGKSSGWASFNGFKESNDLQEVVEWALQKFSNVKFLTIVGYSHGSLVASMFPVLPSVKTSHLLLSYPLGPRTLLTMFNSSSYTTALENLLRHPDSNVLIVFGNNDEFTSQSSYKNWVSGLTGNVEILEIHHGSHFWRGRSAQELVTAVREWVP